MEATLEVRGLCKHYADGDRLVEVLNHVSLDLAGGRSLAVTGPSGSGKSTLLNILAGILAADAGTVVLRTGEATVDLATLNDAERTRLRRRHIGYVYQFFNLVPTLTVWENTVLPARLNKRLDLDARAGELLDQFALSARRDTFPEVLSGGEQQRVAVARALVLQPPLLLADEPTGNLDATNSKHVADLLFSAAREQNVALVIATHSEEIAARADQRLHLNVDTPPLT